MTSFSRKLSIENQLRIEYAVQFDESDEEGPGADVAPGYSQEWRCIPSSSEEMLKWIAKLRRQAAVPGCAARLQ